MTFPGGWYTEVFIALLLSFILKVFNVDSILEQLLEHILLYTRGPYSKRWFNLLNF